MTDERANIRVLGLPLLENVTAEEARGISMLPVDHIAAVSTAISLKRIADTLERASKPMHLVDFGTGTILL